MRQEKSEATYAEAVARLARQDVSRREFLRALSGGAFVLAAGSLLAGCGGGGGGANSVGSSVNLSPPQTPAAGPHTFAMTTIAIPPDGATVQLPNIASITFPAGSFSATRSVNIATTASSDTAGTFDVIAELLGVTLRLFYEIRINVGQGSPSSDSYRISLNVPDSFANTLSANSVIMAFIQADSGGDEESLNNFEPVTTDYDAAAKILNFMMPVNGFSHTRTADSSDEAVIVIAAMNNGASAHAKTTHSLGPITDGLNSPLARLLVITSPFGPRTQPVGRMHWGIDLKANNDSVIAAADGILVMRQQMLRSGPNAGQYDPDGYGLYAIVRHRDGSSTLYAHLTSVDVPPGSVVKGHHIATSGATGGAAPRPGSVRGPHLHFEYVTSGQIIQNRSREDPSPLLQTLSVLGPNSAPPLSVGGTLQIKAIDRAGNLMAEDSDGNPIALEDLQWKSSGESIAKVNQNGLVTALSDGSAIITAIQTSTGANAQVSIQVGQASGVITVQ